MGSSRSRSRLLSWVLPILLITTFVTSVSAQGLFGMGLPVVNAGDVQVRTQARAGYEWLSETINLPLPFSPAIAGFNVFFPSGIDLSWGNASFWVGGLDVEAQFRDSWGLFIKGEINARSSTSITNGEDPFDAPFDNPVQWDGTGLEWWEIEAGAF